MKNLFAVLFVLNSGISFAGNDSGPGGRFAMVNLPTFAAHQGAANPFKLPVLKAARIPIPPAAPTKMLRIRLHR